MLMMLVGVFVFFVFLLFWYFFCFFFFFFQAEDGIRDGHVTGVQTCALPIFQFFGHSWRRVLPRGRASCLLRLPRLFFPSDRVRPEGGETPVRPLPTSMLDRKSVV